MNWDTLKTKPVSNMPEPPRPETSTVRLDRPVGHVDGRKARATGRTKQFNPRVRPEFLDQFNRARALEQDRSGEPMSQAQFLEELLANYQRSVGLEVKPFGLSDITYQGAMQIAERLGWPLGRVLEDAIAARLRDLNLAQSKEPRR